LGLSGSALIVFVATAIFGAVQGTEFCPQTFERRSYSHFELPIIGVQVTGERHEDLTGTTELCLTSNNYITPPAGGKQDWHVLVGSRGTRLRRPGDAGILLQYLDATEGKEKDSTYRWAEWSENHASLAKVFWPAVQRLAIHELYVFMPDLFDLAKTIDDPAKLQKELDRTTAQKLVFAAQRYREHENLGKAAELLDEALELDPENAEIRQARETLPAAAMSKSGERGT
jgi:hypothetical protein